MKKIVFLLFLLLPVFYAEAQDTTAVRRPKIGVTFAGGGAKGAAHIGVLKVLEEVGIPVDYISGTSMGSIIGGLYALGYSAEQMDSIISSLDWNVYLSDKVKSRDYDKRISDNQGKYLITMPFSFKKQGSTVKEQVTEYSDARKERRKYRDEEPSGSGKSFLKSLPGGFANGNNVLNLFNDLSVGYQDSMDFDDLPIPFACVASDLVSGQRAVLRHGKLAEAIRASMAIPGVFAPVKYDGMVLIDGGLHDNFPVDVCQDMGADIVIGIEVSKDRDVEADEISSLPELITRLLDIATQHGLDENRKKCTIYFRPDIKEFNTMSFDNESIRTIIERGYKAADEKRALLIALREELDRLGAPAHTVRNGETAMNMSAISENKVKIGDVSFEGVKPREAKWMANKFKLNGADSLSGVRLNRLLDRCYGTGAFKTLTHYLSPNIDGTYDLKVKAVSAEPHVLGMGLRVDTQEAVALLLRFGLNQNTLSGLKFDLSTRLSYNPRVKINMAYAPMKLGVFYTNLGLGFEHTNLFVTTNLESAAHATFSRYNVEVFASQFHSRFIDVNAGFKLDYFDYSSVLYSDDLVDNESNANHNKFDLLALGLFARFKFDNLDRQYCAERGIRFKFFGDWKMKAAGVDSDLGTFQLNFESYIPVVKNRFVIIPQFYGRMFVGHGYKTENKYFSLSNFVGGLEVGRYFEQQMPFAGLNNPEYMPSVAAILRGDFRVRVYGQHYLTGVFNYCRASEGIQKVFDYSTGYDWFGGAVKYTYDTLFGPLSLDVHYSNAKDIVEGLTFSGSWGVYISIGYYF